LTKTNVYDIPAVIETLTYVDIWLRELADKNICLPNDFDCSLFCSAVDVMIDSEHHQLILRLLTLIYKYADIFCDELRRQLFIELLLKKHFFTLFLHWESTVRNAFQQLVVFKMMREKRSLLQKQGFFIKELASQSIHHDKNNVPSYPSTTDEIDGMVFAKVESYIRMLQDQLRDREQHLYPSHLEVYVPKSMTEYSIYMSLYYQWESLPEKDAKAPNLIPASMLTS